MTDRIRGVSSSIPLETKSASTTAFHHSIRTATRPGRGALAPGGRACSRGRASLAAHRRRVHLGISGQDLGRHHLHELVERYASGAFFPHVYEHAPDLLLLHLRHAPEAARKRSTDLGGPPSAATDSSKGDARADAWRGWPETQVNTSLLRDEDALASWTIIGTVEDNGVSEG